MPIPEGESPTGASRLIVDPVADELPRRVIQRAVVALGAVPDRAATMWKVSYLVYLRSAHSITARPRPSRMSSDARMGVAMLVRARTVTATVMSARTSTASTPALFPPALQVEGE